MTARNIQRPLSAPQKFQMVEEELLQGFWDWLLDSSKFPKLVPAKEWKTPPGLFATVRNKLEELLKRVPDYRLQKTAQNISETQNEMRKAQQFRRYSCQNMTLLESAEQGNIEETRRLMVAALVAKAIHPNENPYGLIQRELADRGDHRAPKAIEQRVQRLRKRIDSGKYGLSVRQIVDMEYSHYKFLSVSKKQEACLNSPLPAPKSYVARLKRDLPDIERVGRKQPEVLQKYLHAPLSKTEIKRLTRLLAFTDLEKAMLEKVCEGSSAEKVTEAR